MIRNKVNLILLLLLTIAGCGEKVPALFFVNGRPVLKSSVEDEAKLKFELFQNAKPLKDPSKVEKAKKGIYQSILAKKLSEIILLEASEKTSVHEGAISAADKRYFTTFHGKLADEKDFHTWLKRKGVFASYQALLRSETQIESFITSTYKDKLSVSDDLVARTIKSMQRGNELASATNAVIYALATNVWKRAQSGDDFTELARKYSNMIETDVDGDIGENCDFNDFNVEDISIWNAVSRLKAGEVTPPLSTSEGLTVYKCYDRVEDPAYAGGARYHLGRIVFFRALLYDNFSPVFVRRELEREAREKVVSSIVSERLAKARVDFPNGEADLPKGFTNRVLKIIRDARK